MQRAAPADQPEPGAVLAARHDLRRRRAGELRAARTCRAASRSTWAAATRSASAAASRPTRCRSREMPTHVALRRVARLRRRRTSPIPTGNRARDSAAGPDYRPPVAISVAMSPTTSRTSAARRRTSTCSRSSSSTSASPCRASSRARPRRAQMAQPYVGEIRMFAGNFAPAGWMFCEGQLLPISENETLFNLIGTTYGGDGQSTFALPDLRGPAPDPLGQRLHAGRDGGVETVTLTVNQIPAHTPPVARVDDACADAARPAGNVLARAAPITPYIAGRPRHATERRSGRLDRRQPAARQLPAVPLRRLHHLAVRHLPVPDLRRAAMDPFVAEIRIFPFNFAPEGLGVLRRADPAALPEHRAVLAARHDLRRRRQDRTSRCPNLQGNAPDAPGPGPGPLAARPRRDGRLARR